MPPWQEVGHGEPGAAAPRGKWRSGGHGCHVAAVVLLKLPSNVTALHRGARSAPTCLAQENFGTTRLQRVFCVEVVRAAGKCDLLRRRR